MRRNLTPITVTHRSPNLRTGQTQIWGAVSNDGVWRYERTEEPGTPWTVVHAPTDRWTLYSSLPKARAATADGSALDWLNREEADRGRT